MKKKRFGLGVVLLILLIIAACFGTLVRFFTDFLWFQELGYTSVFFKQLFTQLKLGIPTFIVITLLCYVYLKTLKRGYLKKIEVASGSDSVSDKTINRLTWGLAAVFGILVTLSTVTKLWFEILKFSNSTDFGIKDPIFNLDISFYVFKLQFVSQINGILLGLVIAFAVVTLLYYTILLSTRRPQVFETVQDEPAEEAYEEDEGPQAGANPFGSAFGGAFGGAFKNGFGTTHRRPKKQFDTGNFNQLLNIASKQIIVLGVVFFLMIAINFVLKQFNLLYSHTGVLFGAGFTDINITLWVYRILIVLSLVAALFFALGVKSRSWKKMLTVPVIMIVLGAVGTGAAGLVQNLVVSPDEFNKQAPYLQNNITYTQHAYDLQDISVKEFAANNDLTREDVLNNKGTINNIRINDFEPAEQFYNQTQSIRSYYQFNDVDVDRYMVNGEYTQTFLSAREINEANISDSWINQHLQYTHGYGITLSRVDKVTASGQPDMLIKSIPPVSAVDEIQVTRPEIYFGELTNNYIITNTNMKEFDYPSGEGNADTTYEGTGGIKLNLLNRVAFAIREQSLKMLVSTNIDSNSKIIINRNIEERVQKIAPFLQYDDNPYVVTVDGKLYWIIDAYTKSSYYPYSEPYTLADGSINPERTNYIRNSVKVVIDAYNGDTNYYLVDDKDPIANTLTSIYPQLFKSADQMPQELRAHIRYPNFMFGIQGNVYKKYHMNDVKVFYQKEDLWAIATQIFGSDEVTMEPTYYIMKLPGETDVEFINSLPYTPNGKKNMTGLLVARNDGDHYGELVLYRLPKSKVVYGPMQVEGLIDQDDRISQDFSLWSSKGTKYSRGDMFVIPMEESLLYVEPVYLEGVSSSLPEVKRVIVAYNDQIAYEDTLAEALNDLFGTGDYITSVQQHDENGKITVNQAGLEGGLGEGGTAANPGTDGSGTVQQGLGTSELIKKANEAFEAAESAQKNGDWAGYGKHLSELKQYLKQLEPAGASEAAGAGAADDSAAGASAPDQGTEEEQ